MKYIIILDRIFAWLLLICVIAYIVTGYGMTKGIIDRELARYLHLVILPYATMISLVGHTSYAIHLALKRWNAWNIPMIIVYIIFFLSLIGGFVYFEEMYIKKTPASVQTKIPAVQK